MTRFSNSLDLATSQLWHEIPGCDGNLPTRLRRICLLDLLTVVRKGHGIDGDGGVDERKTIREMLLLTTTLMNVRMIACQQYGDVDGNCENRVCRGRLKLKAGWWLGRVVDRRGLPHGDQVLSDDPGPLGFGAEAWVLSFVISGHA